MKTEIMNKIKSAQYEIELNAISNNIDLELNKDEMYMTYIDLKYEDKLRDLSLIESVKEKTDTLLYIINKINNLETKAIEIKDYDLMMRCESNKAKLINMMEYMNNKYMM